MRIAVVRPYASLPSDGASNDRYINLCKVLVARDICVKLYCSSFVHNKKSIRTNEDREYNSSKYPFICEIDSIGYTSNVSIRRILYELLFGLKTVRALHKMRPTNILVGEPLFFVGWLILIYALIFRIKVKADVIDIWPEADVREAKNSKISIRKFIYSFLKISRKLRMFCYRDLSFVSKSYATLLHLDSKESNVFYWGSDLKATNSEEEISSLRPFTIVYAGSFGDGYDLQTVLDAAGKITANPTVSVVFKFAGDGPCRSDIENASDAGIIEYVGNMGKESLIELYKNSDVGLLPYKTGSKVAMPIKYFDYVNFGLFCLSSLTLEVKEVIQKKKIGLNYTAGDSEDLYTKILQLANNVDKTSDIKKISMALADHYSISCQYNAFADWVEK